ncbi:MAG: 3'(2'),5'-bisphosphate nucleotidase CysQ [Gammaproteobacteria bacterium]|jgi:3'(2'), 5'-bisphosphate nucleotidase
MKYKGLSDYPPEQLLDPVLDISRQASRAILEVYNSDFGVEKKDDDSPLTAADMASHTTICKALSELTPEIPILSEESVSIPYTERKQWELYWLVDPLDGTKEFVKRNGEFTVNIALIYQNQPVLGVVYIPVTDVGYIASQNKGAFKIIPGNTKSKIHTRNTTADNITVAGSRSHANDLQKRFFQTLGPNTEIINRGSSLKFCLIAEGSIDLYPRFGPTSEWDTAAAHCVVREAGGDVTDMNFRSLTYNTMDSILNPHFLVIGDPDFDWAPYLESAKNNGQD